MKTVRVTAASTSARWGRIDANLTKIVKAAEKAAEDGARLVLLPECCLTGADWPRAEGRPGVEEVALKLGGSVVREVAGQAKRLGLIIAVGLYERRGAQVNIAQVLLGPRGLLGVYRKVHEGGRSSGEQDLFPVFDIGFARVGISICRDVMLPECSRILALRGAELLLAPFASLPLSQRAWRLQRLLALRSRAQDNRLFVLSASHAQPHVSGRPPEWGYSGICCAVDPLGQVIGESRGRVGHPQQVTVTLRAELRRSYVLGDIPGLRDRRAGDYAALTDEKVQRRYLREAAPFRYNDQADLLTVRSGRK